MQRPFPLINLMAICLSGTLLFACNSPIPENLPTPNSPALTPQPTLTPESVQSLEDIDSEVPKPIEPQLYEAYDSPNGRWRTEVMLYDYGCPSDEEAWSTPVANPPYEVLLLTDLQDGRVREVDRQERRCVGFGGYGFDGLEWASNSRYFFYTNARAGNIGGGCGYLATPILRLDLDSLESTPLGSGMRSPDQTRYVTWFWVDSFSLQLVITQIEQGEISKWTTVVKKAQMSSMAWSPDSQSLAYVQTETGCPFGQSYVTRLDLTSGEQRLLLSSESPTYAQVEWHEPTHLLLRDGDSQAWHYDLASGTIEPVE